jgi:flagellar assembly protein FliH
MSTRVIAGDRAAAIQPMEWPAPSNSGAGINDPERTERENESTGQAASLEERIEELEREISRTRDEGEAKASEALAAGREQGEAELRQTLQQELHAEIGKLSRMMQDLVAAGPVLRRNAEDELVRLAVAVARRILHREIAVDGEVLLGLVKAALEKIDQREVHVIRTHPDTVPLLRRVLEQGGIERRIEISADRHLDRGALIVETERGQLDASIEAQLQEIERGFADIVGNQG